MPTSADFVLQFTCSNFSRETTIVKKLILSIAAVAALIAGMGDNAQASFLFGSINFNQSLLSPNGTTGPAPDRNLLTIVTFTTDFYVSGSSATGDFIGTPVGTLVNGFPLNTTSPATLATWGFTSPSFGNFVASSGSQVYSFSSPAGNFRGFAFTGTFTPGTLYPGKTGSPNNATLLLGFTQAGGTGRSISSSFTIDVEAAAVPEPASIVMLGSVFGPAVAFGWMHRRRRLARA
jgi:hypothetical protein